MPTYADLVLQSEQKIASARLALATHIKEEADRVSEVETRDATRLAQEELRRQSFDVATAQRDADEATRKARAHTKRERLQAKLDATLLACSFAGPTR